MDVRISCDALPSTAFVEIAAGSRSRSPAGRRCNDDRAHLPRPGPAQQMSNVIERRSGRPHVVDDDDRRRRRPAHHEPQACRRGEPARITEPGLPPRPWSPRKQPGIDGAELLCDGARQNLPGVGTHQRAPRMCRYPGDDGACGDRLRRDSCKSRQEQFRGSLRRTSLGREHGSSHPPAIFGRRPACATPGARRPRTRHPPPAVAARTAPCSAQSFCARAAAAAARWDRKPGRHRPQPAAGERATLHVLRQSTAE